MRRSASGLATRARRRSNVAFGSIWRAKSFPPRGSPGTRTATGSPLAAVGGGEAESLGEAPGRVHRENERPPPAPRRGEADGGGERRLPDAAGAGQHDELLAVQPGAEVEMRLLRREERERRRFA